MPKEHASVITVGSASKPKQSAKKPARRGTRKTAARNKRSAPKRNPVAYPNIDKSAFKRGEYVGYADGVWRIAKYGKGYRAAHRENKYPVIIQDTLKEISARLDAIASESDAKRYGFDKPKKNPRPAFPGLSASYFVCAIWEGRGRNASAHKGKLVFWDGFGWTLNRKNALKVTHSVAKDLGKTAAATNPGTRIGVCRNDEREANIIADLLGK